MSVLSYFIGETEQVIQLGVYSVHFVFAFCRKVGFIVFAVEVFIVSYSSFFAYAIYAVYAVKPYFVTGGGDFFRYGDLYQIDVHAGFGILAATPYI